MSDLLLDVRFDSPSAVLFGALLRVVALLAVSTILVSALRRSSASLRALIWTAALAGALVLPLISLAAPPLEIAVLPAERVVDMPSFAESNTQPLDRMSTANTSPQVERSADARDNASSARHPAVETPMSSSPRMHTAPSNVLHAAERTIAEPTTAEPTTRLSIPPISTLLAGAWILGALLFLVRLALGHSRLHALVLAASDADNDWHTLVAGIRNELGVHRHVGVRISRDIDIPAVAGVFTPVLLLPASLDLSASAKRDVALHELAHVARWDALAQLLGNVACAMYWFVPLTWYAARHAAALREEACDNVVLRAGTRPSLYAERLLTFSHGPMSTALEPVALAMARPARIQRRVLGILDPNTRRTRLSATFTSAFMAASLAMVALAAIVQPVSAIEPDQEVRTPVAQAPTLPSGPAGVGVSSLGSPVALTTPAAVSPNVRVVALALAGAPATPELPVPAPETARSSLAAFSDTPIATEIAVSVPWSLASDAVDHEVATPVATPSRVPQQALTICRNGMKNTSIHSNSSGNSRTWRLTASGSGCDISIRIEGKPVFNRDFTDIVRIEGRGVFELDVREDGIRRELRIRDDDGRTTRTWRVDGRERPYDAEAAAWFAQALIAIDRQTAFGVDVRLPMLLEQGGVNAVLVETGQIPSDYARSVYYRELSKARRLTSQELTNVIAQGAELTKSDYYATELLKGVGSQGLGEPSVRDAVVRLISRMDSDYYRHESIKATVNAARPTTGELGMLVEIVGKMTSDYYRAETIKSITSKADLSSAQLNDVLSIASSMKSDHYINEMLGSVAARGTLDGDKRIAYLNAVRSIDSDFHRSEAVNRLLRNGAPTAGETDLLFSVISEITSDHHMGETLDRVLAFRSLRETDLLRAEEVARRIGSDHTHSEVLRRIGSHASATEQVRSAVHSTAQSLSRHYRDQALRGIER